MDALPGLRFSRLARRAYLWLTGTPRPPESYVRRLEQT